MKNRLRSEWPLAAVLIFWFVFLGAEWITMRGVFAYAGDDAYLRMAIGRNLALNGTWGINPGQFASIVGSLLWPLLLGAADAVVGIHKATPIMINIVLSCFLLAVLDRAAKRVISEPWLRCAAVLLAAVMLPLGPLVLEGMEHTLQILLTVAVAEGVLCAQEKKQSVWIWLPIAAALLAATRYEGLLVVGVAAVFLSFGDKKNIPLAGLTLAAGVLPAAIYGWVSYHQGWLPIPNDVYFRRAPLAPDNLADIGTILLRPLESLNENPALRAITLLPLVAIFWRALAQRQDRIPLQNMTRVLIFIGTAAIHLWLIGMREYRYDAYLLILGWWAVLPWVQEAADYFRTEHIPLLSATGAVLGILCALLLFPLMNRGVSETANWWQARENFRADQMAAVALVEKRSGVSGVATDFPGAFAYQGVPVLDITGMGNVELARARRSGGIEAENVELAALSAKITMAAVQDASVRGYLPAVWERWAYIALPGSGSDGIVLYTVPGGR
jgi:hypothetical protein